MQLLVPLVLLAPLVQSASLSNGAGRNAARSSSTTNPYTVVTSPPSPGSTTVPDFASAWSAAYSQASAAVKQLTQSQLISLTTGSGSGSGTCSGTLAAIPSIGLPGMCLEDGPMAMRPANETTVFPGGINAAATFNRTLMRNRGVAMGAEFKGKGVNVAYGPNINMFRIPTGGRGWESFGGDPFLTGEAGYETILGLQSSGVQATAKHFIGNEQEYARFSANSIIDDRTLYEIYAYPFIKAVTAGVAAIMCSENRINGAYACSNNVTQNTVLKQQIGFQGYVTSDFLATKATSDAAAGLDQTMPGNAGVLVIPVQNAFTSPAGTSFFGGNLTTAIKNGTLTSTRLDDMATRILAAWYLTQQDGDATYAKGPRYTVDVRTTAHTQVARDVAAASIVLLKNTNSALPLSKSLLSKGLAVIGSDAVQPNLPLISAYVGSLDLNALITGWGSGAATTTTFAAPADVLTAQGTSDGTKVVVSSDDWNIAAAQAAATGKSAAIVFLKTDSGEGQIVPPVEWSPDNVNNGDRNNLSAWNNGDVLVNAVAAVNKNTIVVVNSVGPMDLEKWISNANVTAVLWAGVPGQESGNALVDVLYGTVNPSGRLPYTIAKQLSDYAAHNVTGGQNDAIPITYSEKLLIDYRHFDSAAITPRYEFGYGLSYTTFSYSSATATRSIQPLVGTGATNWSNGLTASGNGVSTLAWMHSSIMTVKFTLKNTGNVAGTEVPQMYLHFPSSAAEPPQVLRGFDAIYLRSGASTTVTFSITPMMLSIWDVTNAGWVRPAGTFTVSIGSSSRTVKLTATLPSL